MSKPVKNHSSRTIQSVFVLLLLSLFACLSTFLVTIGAQLYRNTVDSAEKNNTSRIMTAVVRSAIWAEDGGNVIVEKMDNWDITALTVVEKYEDETNYKRLSPMKAPCWRPIRATNLNSIRNTASRFAT